jgi:hypothetical protein
MFVCDCVRHFVVDLEQFQAEEEDNSNVRLSPHPLTIATFDFCAAHDPAAVVFAGEQQKELCAAFQSKTRVSFGSSDDDGDCLETASFLEQQSQKDATVNCFLTANKHFLFFSDTDDLSMVPTTLRAQKAIGTWNQRFQELLEFKRVNGHTNVPQKYPPNPRLGIVK